MNNFWLSLRHKKSVGTLQLLIPHLEALALPGLVERATQIAHADMNIAIPYNDRSNRT